MGRFNGDKSRAWGVALQLAQELKAGSISRGEMLGRREELIADLL